MATAVKSVLKVQKAALRKSISSNLSLLDASAIEAQSQEIAKNILSLASFSRSKSISCFLSMPIAEPDTSSIVTEILHHNKNLFVPKIDRSVTGLMLLLKIYNEDDLNKMIPGSWGIKEPDLHWQNQARLNALDEESEGLDMILVPNVAVDRSFSRLGHGKGYYDRFITSYVQQRGQKPLLVALALREQLLESERIPVGEHDWPMDLIVTPDEIIGEVQVQGQ